MRTNKEIIQSIVGIHAILSAGKRTMEKDAAGIVHYHGVKEISDWKQTKKMIRFASAFQKWASEYDAQKNAIQDVYKKATETNDKKQPTPSDVLNASDILKASIEELNLMDCELSIPLLPEESIKDIGLSMIEFSNLLDLGMIILDTEDETQ